YSPFPDRARRLLTAPPSSRFYPLSLHDALPIFGGRRGSPMAKADPTGKQRALGEHPNADGELCHRALVGVSRVLSRGPWELVARSEEHTSELQSRENLVCRLLLEKKKNTKAHAA